MYTKVCMLHKRCILVCIYSLTIVMSIGYLNFSLCTAML